MAKEKISIQLDDEVQLVDFPNIKIKLLEIDSDEATIEVKDYWEKN